MKQSELIGLAAIGGLGAFLLLRNNAAPQNYAGNGSGNGYSYYNYYGNYRTDNPPSSGNGSYDAIDNGNALAQQLNQQNQQRYYQAPISAYANASSALHTVLPSNYGTPSKPLNDNVPTYQYDYGYSYYKAPIPQSIYVTPVNNSYANAQIPDSIYVTPQNNSYWANQPIPQSIYVTPVNNSYAQQSIPNYIPVTPQQVYVAPPSATYSPQQNYVAGYGWITPAQYSAPSYTPQENYVAGYGWIVPAQYDQSMWNQQTYYNDQYASFNYSWDEFNDFLYYGWGG